MTAVVLQFPPRLRPVKCAKVNRTPCKVISPVEWRRQSPLLDAVDSIVNAALKTAPRHVEGAPA